MIAGQFAAHVANIFFFLVIFELLQSYAYYFLNLFVVTVHPYGVFNKN